MLTIVVALAAGIMAGCQPQLAPEEPRQAGQHTFSPQNEALEKPLPTTETTPFFAGKSFYENRSEPEVTLEGTLIRVPVRTGPNTREHPIRLTTDEGEWGVYAEGLQNDLLDSLLNQPLRITGKWIDQSAEGYAMEFWVGGVEKRLE